MSSIEALATRCGIGSFYVDARGETRSVSVATQAALLAAMGFDSRSEASAARAVATLERQEWLTPLPPVTVHRGGGPAAVVVSVPATTRSIEWTVTLEGGGELRHGVDIDSLKVVAERTLDGIAYVQVTLPLSVDIPFGYHRLGLTPGDATMSLIVAPASCWLPPAIEAGSRLWGLTAQLYLLRSKTDWGIGDFGDLRRLVEIAQPLGADILGVNPLHALFLDAPEQASPYSPASRLLLNVLNIDVAGLTQQLGNEAAQQLVDSPTFQQKLLRCRAAPEVLYTEVAALKLEVLHTLFAALKAQPRSRAWREFKRLKRQTDNALMRACVFLALREHLAAQNPERADWRHWPDPLRTPDSPAVREFVREHPDSIDFHLWLQQVADAQLGEAAAAAGPMAIGLYRDLAVGADPAGAETWSNQGAVVSGAHVGAPPDIYNPTGQDWGLPPFNPRPLRAEGYRSFIDLVRANMRHAGGLRIDHVMALCHLYWVPQGMEPKHGAYVDYPMDDLLGILGLESHRQHCIVVGEDLGTVPEGFREHMAAANIFSYRVLFFERDETGFVPPDRYPRLALGVVSSHDLPTLRAWWDGSDLDLKATLNLFPTPEDEATARAERDRDRIELRQALDREAGLDRASDSDATFQAAHAFLARARCALTTVQLDDITDEVKPVNVPTTADEYPNWRRRLALRLDEIAGSRRLAQLAITMKSEIQKR